MYDLIRPNSIRPHAGTRSIRVLLGGGCFTQLKYCCIRARVFGSSAGYSDQPCFSPRYDRIAAVSSKVRLKRRHVGGYDRVGRLFSAATPTEVRAAAAASGAEFLDPPPLPPSPHVLKINKMTLRQTARWALLSPHSHQLTHTRSHSARVVQPLQSSSKRHTAESGVRCVRCVRYERCVRCA